ncbi:hypothetical protein NIES4072_31990 [Nostoc commune NIES-4072]|uniref:Uncharacterized protein n=1 Tax=Nostoc commune NIES-4072 TaxID=2005467 RepID=A0A2R5FUM7_NOSCO|nr:hypothetical protein NIES4070_58770 [Nostoc commune HK-02]GBG19531.1 hypothetical protein NIES4072_31990 [Nostoc commune NIES-4072]
MQTSLRFYVSLIEKSSTEPDIFGLLQIKSFVVIQHFKALKIQAVSYLNSRRPDHFFEFLIHLDCHRIWLFHLTKLQVSH